MASKGAFISIKQPLPIETELSDSGNDSGDYRHSADTPDSSPFSSPELQSKPFAALPQPFYPPSLEDDDYNRQCLPLPSGFPLVPTNVTPRITAAAVCHHSYVKFARLNSLKDAQTPDKWVYRHPELIRLTGKHPFNSEGYLTPLFDAVSFSYRDMSAYA